MDSLSLLTKGPQLEKSRNLRDALRLYFGQDILDRGGHTGDGVATLNFRGSEGATPLGYTVKFLFLISKLLLLRKEF